MMISVSKVMFNPNRNEWYATYLDGDEYKQAYLGIFWPENRDEALQKWEYISLILSDKYDATMEIPSGLHYADNTPDTKEDEYV